MADQPTPGQPSAPKPERETRMIDVRGMIKQASTRVHVDQLVKKGTKYLSLLSKEKIDELINQAVKNIVDKYRAVAAGVADIPSETLQGEAKQEFNELLSQYQATNKAKNELELTRTNLDQELGELRKELAQQKEVASGKAMEQAEHALVVGFKEFERELDKIVLRVFEKRKLILEQGEDPQAIAELDQIKEKLRAMIQELVKLERYRFTLTGSDSRDMQIAMLEKRIEKLYEQIQAMETALKTISNSKLYSNQQLQNLLRQLGLWTEDRYYEKKRELVKIVLQQNLDLRKKFKELEGPPAAAQNPPPAESPPAAQQPVDKPATV
ncbi:MAG: hypothetical protein HYY17_05440 [Planctomycetes bacterium]|nr:hypothetical protein [Planctomycetota bacterium]